VSERARETTTRSCVPDRVEETAEAGRDEGAAEGEGLEKEVELCGFGLLSPALALSGRCISATTGPTGRGPQLDSGRARLFPPSAPAATEAAAASDIALSLCARSVWCASCVERPSSAARSMRLREVAVLEEEEDG